MAIDLNLELEELHVGDFILSLPGMDNIRAGIRPSGFGLTFDFPISGGIKGGTGVPIRGGIATPFIDPPVSPLAVHMGQGTLYLGWGHPFPDRVDTYELLFSLNHGGPYVKYPTGEFRSLRGTVKNVPIGITIYLQVRAIGKNGAVSTLTQVKKGKFYQPLVSMKVRAISGSKISSGALFSSVDQETGTLITIQAPAVININ